MSERTPRLSMASSAIVVAILCACTATQPSVIEKLDELTAITITYSRTPVILSPNTPYVEAAARDYVQIGPIEVNRMGSLQYFLWLGIADIDHMDSPDPHPKGFEAIVLVVDGAEIPLDVLGWTQAAIGSSEPVYKRLFRSGSDAYFQVTLEQIRLLAEADSLQLRTTGTAPKEFIPAYRQATAKNDLADFLRIVMQ